MRLFVAVVLLMSLLIPAGRVCAVEAVQDPVADVTDVANKVCPVSGNPVSGKVFVTCEGKKYGLCCEGCEKEFLKNPKNYAKAI